MNETFVAIIFIIALILFFYFGYRKDYKKNPKAFVNTILGVIGSFILFFVLINFMDAIIAFVYPFF